jgi:thioredoxin
MKLITSTEFDSEVLTVREPVLVDFFTEHCSPCRAMAPILQEWENEANGTIKIVKVDAAAETTLASSYGVNAVPAFYLFSKGKCVGQTMGLKSKSSIKKWAEEALRSEA